MMKGSSRICPTVWRLLRFCGILEHDLHLLTQGSHLLGREVGDVTPSKVMEPALGSNSFEQRTPRVDLPHPGSPQAKGLPPAADQS